ncbi:MAG: hypothetical protein ACOYXM_14505 [Actinomycetota bacterium]
MPEALDAHDLVRQDVERGIGEWLRADDEVDSPGFRLLEPFDDPSDPLVSPNTGTVAVPWAWVGRHVHDVMGYLPTDRVIEVRGVTIVRDTESGPAFSRFVDWVSALAQMGVVVSSRAVTDEPSVIKDAELTS